MPLNSGGSRISQGAPTYYWPNFAGNCIKMKELGPKERREDVCICICSVSVSSKKLRLVYSSHDYYMKIRVIIETLMPLIFI